MIWDTIPQSEWKYVTGQKQGHDGRVEAPRKEMPDVKIKQEQELN
jgi:hypothetical protein